MKQNKQQQQKKPRNEAKKRRKRRKRKRKRRKRKRLPLQVSGLVTHAGNPGLGRLKLRRCPCLRQA